MKESDFLTKIAALDAGDKTETRRELGVRLRHLIDQRTRGIEYAESRRGFFLTASAALFATGIAILSVTLTKPLWLPFEYALLWLGSTLPLLAVAVWLVHASHVNFKYPLTGTAKVQKWFYRYALVSWREYQIPWIRELSAGAQEADQKIFDRDYETFLDNSQQNLLDLNETLLQDVRQIYLLHVNEMYKNQFLTKLRKVFSIGLRVVLFGALAVFAVGWAVDRNTWPGRDSRQQFGLGIKASWAPAYVTAATSGNFNIQIINQSTSASVVSGIRLLNHQGLTLAYDTVLIDYRFPLRIEAGSAINVSLLVDLKGNRLAEVQSVAVQP